MKNLIGISISLMMSLLPIRNTMASAGQLMAPESIIKVRERRFLAAPTANALPEKRGLLSRRAFLKAGAVGIVTLGAWVLGARSLGIQEPAALPNEGPTEQELADRDFQILAALFRGPVNNYYKRRQETLLKKSPEELSITIAGENAQLLAELKKALEQNELDIKGSTVQGQFAPLGAFKYLHDYFLQYDYWFEAFQSTELIQGQTMPGFWSFTMGEIATHRKNLKERLFERTIDGKLLHEDITFDEVILKEVLIPPYQEIESGKQAYAASWSELNVNPDRSHRLYIIYDYPLLLESGKAFWNRLHTAKPPNVIRWKKEVAFAKKDYVNLGSLLSLELRQRQWNGLASGCDEKEFASEYAALMMDLFRCGNLRYLLDIKVAVQLSEPNEDPQRLMKELKIRQLLAQLTEGMLPSEVLAQIIDWIWTEPKGSILYDAANSLLVEEFLSYIYNRRNDAYQHLNLKLEHLNPALEGDVQEIIHTLIISLPNLSEDEIQRLAKEISDTRYLIETKKQEMPDQKINRYLPLERSTDRRAIELGILQAL